jgi:hypothetical protein
MPFEKPRLLSESEQNIIRGKCLAGHATKEEQILLIGHFDLADGKLRSALESLSGCLPDKIYIYGAYGENWSETEPDPHATEYEVIDFKELLDS